MGIRKRRISFYDKDNNLLDEFWTNKGLTDEGIWQVVESPRGSRRACVITPGSRWPNNSKYFSLEAEDDSTIFHLKKEFNKYSSSWREFKNELKQ